MRNILDNKTDTIIGYKADRIWASSTLRSSVGFLVCKQNIMEKCTHKWHPLAIEAEYDYIIFECSLCKQLVWDNIRFIEYIGHFEPHRFQDEEPDDRMGHLF